MAEKDRHEIAKALRGPTAPERGLPIGAALVGDLNTGTLREIESLAAQRAGAVDTKHSQRPIWIKLAKAARSAATALKANAKAHEDRVKRAKVAMGLNR